MFVRINENVIVNTNNIVWIDCGKEDTWYVKMTDNTEHTVQDMFLDKLKEALKKVNK